MPNHVTTIMKISGPEPKKVLKAIAGKSDDKDYPALIDFEKIIPMPKKIYRGNLGATEEAKYGCDNWYHWSIENWGTKWNAYGQSKKGLSTIQFDTAWSFPLPVAVALSKMFPKNTFHFQYADEDVGRNLGNFKIKDGKIFEAKTYGKNYGTVAKKFACKVLGYDYAEYAQEVSRE